MGSLTGSGYWALVLLGRRFCLVWALGQALDGNWTRVLGVVDNPPRDPWYCSIQRPFFAPPLHSSLIWTRRCSSSTFGDAIYRKSLSDPPSTFVANCSQCPLHNATRNYYKYSEYISVPPQTIATTGRSAGFN